MKIKSTSLGLIIVVILFGGIFISSSLNIWKTQPSKTPQKLTEGEFKGKYDPADIRGSYTFDDVSKAFDIPLGDLKAAFVLPDEIDAASFKNKDLKELYSNLENGIEIGNASVKLFAALYTGLPYDMNEDIYLPRQGVEILETNSSLTQEQLEYLHNHTVDIKAENQLK